MFIKSLPKSDVTCRVRQASDIRKAIQAQFERGHKTTQILENYFIEAVGCIFIDREGIISIQGISK